MNKKRTESLCFTRYTPEIGYNAQGSYVRKASTLNSIAGVCNSVSDWCCKCVSMWCCKGVSDSGVAKVFQIDVAKMFQNGVANVFECGVCKGISD